MTEPTDDKPPGLSRVHRRLIEPVERDDDLSYQHTVLCQTGLPYRNPGDAVRTWKRINGAVALQIEAGGAWDPIAADFVQLGLPWGTKPRLILAHLNTTALQQGSPVIEIENSLTAFVRRIRGFEHGREIRMFKEQLARLSVALVRLAMTRGERAFQIDAKIVTAFELWPPADTRQRTLWPATVTLSKEYFGSLQKHAVPLREADLGALAHSALALDVYAWLAQRLHRIGYKQTAFVPWEALHQQFGPEFDRIRDFRAKFLIALKQVLARYQAARIDVDEHGLRLHRSVPPVSKRMVMLPKSAE